MNLERFASIRKTVTTSAGEIGYAEVGEGPPALFVHGLFVSSYMWGGVMEQVSDGRRCVAYDLPAHGLSPANPDQDLSLQGQSDVLEAFCEAMGLEEIDLVANDTGGAIAQALAVRRPELLRSFTLTNCEADDVLPADDPLPQAAAELARNGQLADAVMQATDPEFARGELGIAPALQYPERIDAELLAGLFEPHSTARATAEEIQRTLASLDAADLVALKPGLERLEVPTMMVWGTGDQFFPVRLAHWLKETIPGATEVVEVEGGKLFWPFERPDELVPHLRRHWAAAAERQPA
jgi:pimeloyl-ACP methyl ester carboxylesterase